MNEDDFASIFFWERLKIEAEERLVMMPGAMERLKNAKKSYKTALVTSSPMKVVETTLNRFGIMELFNVVVSVDEILNGKPHPDPYLMQ